MKKIIFILLLSLSSFLGYSQFNEDFESAPETADGAGVWAMNSGNWLVKDNRTNTVPNWRRNNPPGTFTANSGVKAAFVDRNNLPGVQNAEEWLITPSITVPVGGQLRFFTRQTLIGDDNSARYQVRVSSSPDQGDLTAYTVLEEYTETQLSSITADQLDYEEKVINLSFSGARYFAFVRVVTQPALAPSGDRWLVDDMKIVERCQDPSVLTVDTGTITATTTRFLWRANTTQFQVQYGPAGFVVDQPGQPNVVTSDVFTAQVNPNGDKRYDATGLLPNIAYQYYVRSVCADSNSDWIGPFNWNTKPLGRTCTEPIPVTPLPFSDTSNTSIYGSNINGSPGSTGCGTSGPGFLAGNDVVYTYTATDAQNIYISMNPNGATNTGIFVYANNCSGIGNTCMAGVGNANSSIRIIPTLALTAGQTIFIVISSTSATPSFGYNLNIQVASPCAQPTGLGVTAPIGATSATATWTEANTIPATAWEVAVQTAGSAIPSTAGAPSAATTFLMTTTLAGAPLAPSTAYQYWVRADCGGGVFSPWSGPFLFNTSGCEATAQCNYTFNLSDTGGNGWEGGRMQVIQGGIVVATLGATITGGGPTAVTVPLCTNQPFSLFWSVAGDSPDEVRINIRNNFTQTIYAMTVNSQALIGTTLYTGNVDCENPLCLPPTGNPTVPAATITFNNAVVNWNATGTATTTTGWELLVVTQGSPAPTNGAPCSGGLCYTVPGPGTTFTIPVDDLDPDTNYTVYIRSICSVNSPSAWSGGTNFRTKEQCPKPTALNIVTGSITPFGATLLWTNAGQTSWQIVIQPAADPEPPADSPLWTTITGTPGTAANTFTYAAAGLDPEKAYEYYIRTDCGGGILSNPAGPRAFTTGIACPKPTALGSTPTPFGGTFTWTNPNQSAWQVLVLVAGSPPPTSDSTGWITVNPGEAGPGPTWSWVYNGPDLTPEFNYVYYVRTNCGGINGVSTWAGPRAFTTTPTCFKPTAFNSVAASLTAFSATLTWNSVASTTAWQIIALPQGSPAPTATVPSSGWITINPGEAGPGPLYTFTYPGLTPEKAYSFYIRGNCEPGNGISTWTGPRNVTTPPSCYKPNAQTATEITAFTAKLGWTNNPNSLVNDWQILIVDAGTTAPTTEQQGTAITQNPFTATALTPDKCYEYYVRSVCGGVNGMSTWTGPFRFCTIPTCPQPTNAIASNTSGTTSTLSWTEPGTATQWEIIYQTPSGPIPGPNSTGETSGFTVVGNTVSFVTNALDPGFYEYYVRSICSDTDKSRWTGPITFFIALPPAICASIDIPFPTTSPGIIDLCPGESCVDLTGVFTESKDTTTYTVLPLGFAPPFPFTGGTQLPVTTDDVWSEPFTLPFNFCFYGVNYPEITVGSNGVITFDDVSDDFGCPWNTAPDQLLPDPTFPILNAIYGVYQDINPNVLTGASPADVSINYQVLGVAPCRAFVVNYYKVGQFDCDQAVGLQTSQIVLYETSNIIEVYIENRTVCAGWNEGSGVVGIQNASGTIAHVPPNRNLGTWETENEAWRFTPDGDSNVEFSWLKGGDFYSSEPSITVCVSETTTMTAKAVYTGCGGQITTKTKDVLLRIQELEIPPMQNVQACQTYTLPVLTVGNYFSQPGGVGPIDRTIPLTSSQTVYVYASTQSTPPCTDEIQFEVEIVPNLVAPTPPPAVGCRNYVLPALPIPFNYYTDTTGGGTMYAGAGGDIITTPQTLYIYGVSGLCTAQSTVDIAIDTVTLATQASISDCNNVTLPTLPANNTYYTATGGPNGTGTPITDLNITETQTIYIYAQSGTCTDEGNFTVNIFGVDPPTLSVVQPTCATTTGTITVTAPVSPGGALASDIFISEVTDEDASGSALSYIELFNGTGSPKDLSNYKLKVYNNGNNFTSCEVTLTGILANNDTNIIKVSNSPNRGGVTPDQSACNAGVNENDNFRITTLADVEVDLWGATDGSNFTPDGQTGYTYRRNTTAPAPSTVWNPADWSTLPDPDYSDINLYPATSSNVYQYNIDGGPWQFTTVFNNVALGLHTITVQDIITGCTNSVQVTIAPQFVNAPVTDFTYTTPVCNTGANITPTNNPNMTPGGTYSANSPLLVINGTDGTISTSASTPGTYTVTYAVLPDLPNCISGGQTDFQVTINAVRTPDFTPFSAYCPGAAVPTLDTTDLNGIVGVWSPTSIDNQTVGTATYTFTPNADQCASVRTYNITISTPTIVPVFSAVPEICAGSSINPLPLASNDTPAITGTWLPATVDNTQTTTYTFTPNPGQCALQQTLTITVNQIETPDFATTLMICEGATVPALQATSPNGITGTWSPNAIDPNQSGDYVFTANPLTGHCYNTQTLEVTVSPNPVFQIEAGCIGSNYTLTVTSQTDFQGATFVWKNGSGAVIGGNTSSIVVTAVDTYTVEVTHMGCSKTEPRTVTTISCLIQKGISPKGTGDGDGLNDYFDLTGQNVTKLEIFNRYGSKVYTKSNYTNEWYGQSDNGDELPDGTYFYVIERNGDESKTGWIYINHEL